MYSEQKEGCVHHKDNLDFLTWQSEISCTLSCTQPHSMRGHTDKQVGQEPEKQ